MRFKVVPQATKCDRPQPMPTSKPPVPLSIHTVYQLRIQNPTQWQKQSGPSPKPFKSGVKAVKIVDGALHLCLLARLTISDAAPYEACWGSSTYPIPDTFCMTAANSPNERAANYPPATISRAERAVRCSPFRLPLFATMRWEGVALRAIAGQEGIQNRYTRHTLNELAAEAALLWLVQVGMLRREVDGQGLTDSFRLTPLGRQLVQTWETKGEWSPPSLFDRVYNALARWVRLPVWLR